jgi:catechol-2,3-dioxygenase
MGDAMASAVPRVSGVLETSLYVDDLERAAAFYRQVFGFETFHTDSRMIAMGVPGEQALLLFHRGASADPVPGPAGGIIPGHDGSGHLHVCFAIPFGELQAWERHLAALDIPIESRLHWPAGGTSLYFRDPDRNAVEVATPGLWPNR